MSLSSLFYFYTFIAVIRVEIVINCDRWYDKAGNKLCEIQAADVVTGFGGRANWKHLALNQAVCATKFIFD